MKDMYIGDVGDFGKYGLIKALLRENIKIGVNWYLTKDESNNSDGKFIEYLNDEDKNFMYKKCDQHLYSYLKHIVENEQRSVKMIESYSGFSGVKFYSERLSIDHITGLSETGRKTRIKLREDWFAKSMGMFKGCNLIFCDPDNGFIPKSMSLTKSRSVKYVTPDEVEFYFNQGMSIMIYNHRDRSNETDYFNWILKSLRDIDKKKIKGVRFKRYNVRDYILVIQDEHLKDIEQAIYKVNNSDWKELFSPLNFV